MKSLPFTLPLFRERMTIAPSSRPSSARKAREMQKPPASKPPLTVEERAIVVQFIDAAAENPHLRFEQVLAKVLGHRCPDTPTGQRLRRECKAVINRERV